MLAVCAFACAAAVCAKDVTVKTTEGIAVTYALNASEKIARVKGYTETMKTKITIPSKIKVDGVTYTVTKIGKAAFKYSDFRTVNIPNTITLIDQEAFMDSWVKKCDIPSSVETIGANAFKDAALTSVTIPANCSQIGLHAFSMSSLTKVVIEESPRIKLQIGAWAFAGSSITQLTLPYRVNKIGEGAFSKTDLTSVVWPDGISVVPDYCFNYCTDLATVKIPVGVTGIGMYAFANTAALKNVDLPNSLRIIGEAAFYRTGLDGVQVPEGVVTLEEDAFHNSESLKTIRLPSTLKSIGLTCFQGCDAVTKIYCDALVPPVCANSVFANGVCDRAELIVPHQAEAAYRNADTWWMFFSRAGVDDVINDNEDDNAPAEYYDLSGRRLASPRAGQACIVRRNGKACKVVAPVNF